MSSTDPKFKESKTEVRRGGVGCTKDIKKGLVGTTLGPGAGDEAPLAGS